MNRFLILMSIGLLAGTAVQADPRDFPRPPGLERDVAFWTRIYSEVGTDGGLIHDTRDLSIVYEVVKLPRNISGRARERHTDKLKKKYKRILQTLANGKRTGLTREEQRVLALFGPTVSNKTLRAAQSRLRFQLGQADKFRAGVVRSGTYKSHILNVLREMNLPLEIANLPHVESSYTPTVYSRVGAAGLWQFTRSTGRRFMQVDHIVDERLDPYRASVAAARLLEQNHRVTGSWPLAITAYNHGAAGMRRAVRKLGTKDIHKIVRNYQSRTFGFASRNFYVEFLAADGVASRAESYFGPLVLDQPIAYETVEMPFYTKPKELAKAIGIDIGTLKQANPGLRPAVWNEAKYIPKGYEIRVPRTHLPRPLRQAIASVPDPQRYARQTRDASYTVRRGDTLSSIARRNGVRVSQLVSLNGLKSRNRIRVGQKLRLPGDGKATSQVAYKPSREKAKRSAPARKPERPAELPKGGIYRVQRGDNLTEIANRFGLSVSELVSLNGLRSRHRIAIGQKLIVTTAAPNASPVPLASDSTKAHPDAVASLSPARSADTQPSASDRPLQVASNSAGKSSEAGVDSKSASDRSGREVESTEDSVEGAVQSDDLAETESEASDESAVEPSPGLLADPSDYTVASDGTILVQANETLGHYADWLGLRASRLRQINKLRYGQTVGIHQRLRLDFSQIGPDAFERIRVEYHRALQEDFFAEWEIEGTSVHRVGPGDSLWILSTRRFDVPIWLLRQYNPDVDLESLSRGTKLTIPKLRQRTHDTSSAGAVIRGGAAG